MEDFIEFGDRFGWAVAIIIVIIASQKDRIGAILSKWLGLGVRRTETQMVFDEALRERALDNGRYSRALVDKLLDQAETERIERRAANAVVLEQSKNVEVLAANAIEVMKDFADIARSSANGQVEHTSKLIDVLSGLDKNLEKLGSVLSEFSPQS